MLQVSGLFIYPIKSLGGFEVSSARVTDRGLDHDRRWMLVDAQNRFLTQRSDARLALLQTAMAGGRLTVSHKQTGALIALPGVAEMEKTELRVKVWGQSVRAWAVSREADEWISDHLGARTRLVYMPDTSRRPVDGRYGHPGDITSFSDAFPFMIIGQASLDDLNSRLKEPVPMNRFRPNLVFSGGRAFEEDGWARFRIGSIVFEGVKLCARCVVTTIDQAKGTKGKEPLKTLSRYRQRRNKIYFGQNLVHSGFGSLQTGDEILVETLKPLPVFGSSLTL